MLRVTKISIAKTDETLGITSVNVTIGLANSIITCLYFLPLMIEIFNSGGGGFGHGLLLIPFLVIFHIMTLIGMVILIRKGIRRNFSYFNLITLAIFIFVLIWTSDT